MAKGRGPIAMALAIARRELRGGLARFGIFLACLGLGVGVIAMVGSISAAVDAGIRKDARALLGGDVEITQSFMPLEPEQLDFVRQYGEVSHFATMRSMAKPPGDALPMLVELKAVGDRYPLYGELLLDPPMALPDALARKGDAFGGVCEPGLLPRMELSLGDTIRLGEADIVLESLITTEPDRRFSAFTLGPRLMVSMAALEASGLAMPGSLVRHVYDVKLRSGVDSTDFSRLLREKFPQAGWRVRDYKDASPRVREFIDRLSMFLTFVGLASILVGGLGMGNAVTAYLESKERSIAVIKCLGASRALVTAAYLAQVMFLALIGTLAGLILGALAPYLAAWLLVKVLPIPIVAGLYAFPLLTAAGFGLLTAMVFSLKPLLTAGRTPAAGLFRGYIDFSRRGLPARLWAVVALAGLILAGYAVLVTPETRMALYFAAGALGAFVVFGLAAMVIRLLAARIHPRNMPRLRLAVRGLSRPGNATATVVFALGLGLTVLVAVNLTDASIVAKVTLAIPKEAPAFFFIDIQPDQAEAFDRAVSAVPGVLRVERRPMLRARIVKINGVDVEKAKVEPDYRWAIRSSRGVSLADAPPANNPIQEGSWWRPGYEGPPLVSIAADIAEGFHVHLGDTLTVNVLGREFTATIANTREVDWETLAMNFALIFPENFAKGAPLTHIATLYTDPDVNEPDTEARVLRAMADKFPNITAISLSVALDNVSRIVSGIGAAVRSLAGVALLAGILVLAGALRANTRRRTYESVVLKVVGATRGDVLATLALEYAFLGLAAAVVSAALGSLFAWLMVTQAMKTDFTFAPAVVAATCLMGMAVTVVLGLSGIMRVLGEKPAAVLRNE